MDNTTSASISIQWSNLTSLLNRKVLHYVILLNRTSVNVVAFEVTDGSKLSTEIGGLHYFTNYEVMVFGVDERGQPYKTLEVNATTRNSKNVYTILTLNKLFSLNYNHLLGANFTFKIMKTI